jgi:hypothetical protein
MAAFTVAYKVLSLSLQPSKTKEIVFQILYSPQLGRRIRRLNQAWHKMPIASDVTRQKQ